MKKSLFCIAALSFVGVIIGSFLFDKTALVQWIQEHRILLDSWIQNHYVFSVFVYISLYILGVAFSLPISITAMTLGGYLYGSWLGTVYAVCAATIGAACAFVLIRYIFSHMQTMHKIRIYKRYVQHMNMHVLLALRLMVFVPFFAINIAAGISRVSFFTFFWTTAIGIIPEVFLHVSAGSHLAQAQHLQDLLSVRMVLLLTGAAILVLLPVIIRYTRYFISRK